MVFKESKVGKGYQFGQCCPVCGRESVIFCYSIWFSDIWFCWKCWGMPAKFCLLLRKKDMVLFNRRCICFQSRWWERYITLLRSSTTSTMDFSKISMKLTFHFFFPFVFTGMWMEMKWLLFWWWIHLLLVRLCVIFTQSDCNVIFTLFLVLFFALVNAIDWLDW